MKIKVTVRLNLVGCHAGGNPAYDSLDSPRSLLDGAVSKVIERFGSVMYLNVLGLVLDIEDVEVVDRADIFITILTAPPDVICKAIISLFESEGEQK